MSPNTFDCIVIGSGAGGSAAAYRLAHYGLDVCVIDKGDVLPRDGSTLDLDAVVHAGRFKSREAWRDGRGRTLTPEEYFNVGGKTKWYGAALPRFARHELLEDSGHGCRAWPLSYDALAPYYDEAESLLQLRTFTVEPDLARIVHGLQRTQPGWQAQPMPLGLHADILRHSAEAIRVDGFASVGGLKSDAETSLLSQLHDCSNFTLLTRDAVAKLVPHPSNPRRVVGVQLESGRVLRADTVLLAAGALQSPRLLERYLRQTQLLRRLPCGAHVGRYLKLHLRSAVVAVSPRRQSDVLRRTVVLLHPRLVHSSIQPLGFDSELISTLIPTFVPRRLADAISHHAYGFVLQTEDGSHAENRVMDGAGGKPPVLDYDPRRLGAALSEHLQMIRCFRKSLARMGMVAFSQRIGVTGTAHACGTLIAGVDPADSVVNAEGRVHGMEGLYVVDGSVLPRSSRVNPSLTIYAWSLYVADRLARRLGLQTISQLICVKASVHGKVSV